MVFLDSKIFELPCLLGAWTYSSHRVWEWYLHDNGKIMYRIRGDNSYDKYVKANDRSHRYYWVSTVGENESCKPVSVKMSNDNCVRYRSTADLIPDKEVRHETFWDVLEEGGGEWKWEFIDDKYKQEDMTWLREDMINGTLVWCSDGSYKRKVAPRVSGAG